MIRASAPGPRSCAERRSARGASCASGDTSSLRDLEHDRASRAAGQKIALPADVSITADVGIGPITGGYGIQVAMAISVPGMERAAAEKLVHDAHQVCPYSNATRGNIDVTLTVV